MSRVLYVFRKGNGTRGLKPRLMLECRCGHIYNATIGRAAAERLTRCKVCRYTGQSPRRGPAGRWAPSP